MRRALFGLIILCFSLMSKASPTGEMSAYRRPDGGITLTGENCDLLKRHLSALAAWKTLLNETPSRTQDTCTCDSFKCYIGIDTVAPNIVENYQDVDAGRWGPNCWNTALVSNKIIPVLRFTPPAEMSFWMASPLCKAVPEDDFPAPGDIVAIRDSEGKEVHAFVYVTDELAFSKNYLTTVAPYKLQATSAVYTEFPVPFACRQRIGHPQGCPTYANVFRCSSLPAYIEKNKIAMSTSYTDIEGKIRDQENIVSQIVFQWKINLPLQHSSPQLLKEAQGVAGGLKAEISAQSIDKKNSADQKLLWMGLKFRIDGLLQSIDWI